MTDEEDTKFWMQQLEEVVPIKHSEQIIENNSRKKDKIRPRINKEEYLTKQDFSLYSKYLDDHEFGGIDNSTLTKFKREEFKPEAVLDLHGFTENQAFEAVENFIAKCYNRGLRCIIIVTGKGLSHNNDEDIFAAKGVLRKSVPQWLNLPHLRSAILVYKNPSAKLGGAGALYILLRRNKKLNNFDLIP